ncbi:ER lumen protein-retaining receptor erd-2.2 [Caenorhabditis elegans]|uniref:ER lumen protein-retaining receptor erd-2.2 n=1 Tax=Caenorhabditis elegans TaxID=6239 RepID=ERD22_CAEEL|nr:ER lumen protein-retaining receptor erd-2.2 [Caenorhabditis elegans]Q09473.1 RecName: Full=ER lumen protein-retaining receptor erd-2.2 [Caenorhabditis elegans]CCD65964.1 ER lumen protein-retaining receptor erd-2.2 [Caenorhabditis elegans]|eukprot:NP_498282.1 Putative ER lumen protein-retaining receptor C28H8.4 [Caenorhabditis elegans]
MNIFRISADMSHLLAIIILLLKIWKSRSCSGISARSQILFALVFTARYLDLFSTYISLYNTTMKITFLAATYATVYLMFFKFRSTYMRESDTFRVELLIVPAAILALLINHDFAPFELLWTFSIYLEAVAILPQLFLLQSTGSAEVITAHYLFALGSYRALYIFNWIYRYYTEDYFDPIVVVAGIVQTVLYADFFYLYVTRVVQTRKGMELPI